MEINPKDIIIRLFRKRLSVILLLLGRRDSGKTDFSLLIAETLFDNAVLRKIATNIKIISSKFPIKYVNSLEALEYWCKEERGKKLFIFDEIGTAVRRRTPMSSLNIKFLDHLQVLRKYKLSQILIAPSEKYIDSATLGTDMLDATIIKPFPLNRKIATYIDELENFKITFYNLPATNINFDTFNRAIFTKDDLSKKAIFKDEDKNILWEWAHGKTSVDLNLNRNQLRRKVHKYIIRTLERERYPLP